MAGLLTPLRLYMAGGVVVAFIAFVGWVRWDARQDIRNDQILKEKETLERINDALTSPRTPDEIRERLRQLAR